MGFGRYNGEEGTRKLKKLQVPGCRLKKKTRGHGAESRE
jgi:hypothetical protein